MDLDPVVRILDRPRTAVVLDMGDRQFRISRVVTGVHKIYGDFLIAAGKYLEMVARLNEMSAEEVAALQRDAEAFVDERERMIDTCLELILVKNGYEYDRQWWNENADFQDREQFIVEAINKDLPAAQKKSLAEMAGGSIGDDSPPS